MNEVFNPLVVGKKYEGKSLKDLPSAHVRWMISNMKLDRYRCFAMQELIKRGEAKVTITPNPFFYSTEERLDCIIESASPIDRNWATVLDAGAKLPRQTYADAPFLHKWTEEPKMETTTTVTGIDPKVAILKVADDVRRKMEKLFAGDLLVLEKAGNGDPCVAMFEEARTHGVRAGGNINYLGHIWSVEFGKNTERLTGL